MSYFGIHIVLFKQIYQVVILFALNNFWTVILR